MGRWIYIKKDAPRRGRFYLTYSTTLPFLHLLPNVDGEILYFLYNRIFYKKNQEEKYGMFSVFGIKNQEYFDISHSRFKNARKIFTNFFQKRYAKFDT